MNSIIITGASSGIGRAVSERFLRENWQVGVLARRKDLLESLASDHSNALVLPCDVTAPDQVTRAFSEFTARWGRIDVLFNNAGIFTPAGLIDEISIDDWERALSVNLTGMFLCARAAFGQMRRQTPAGGRIINNGSISAHSPRPGAVSYTATKHAITGLTRQLALDGRPFAIVCGQIDIGNARTDLLETVAKEARAAGQPEPPTFDVEFVADAIFNMARLPLSANVLFQTIMASGMPYVGRG
jgi:NAD(P)-dependent dehydrogenase (short-subunit alcohol dehydrogenase family)